MVSLQKTPRTSPCTVCEYMGYLSVFILIVVIVLILLLIPVIPHIRGGLFAQLRVRVDVVHGHLRDHIQKPLICSFVSDLPQSTDHTDASRELYMELREYIMSLDDDISMKPTKLY